MQDSTQPIFRIPDELLSMIFMELYDALPPDSYFRQYDDLLYGTTRSGRRPRPILPEPLVIASVCRHWRQIAIKTPSLWSRPPMRSPELLRVMLTRSRPSPLHVDMGWRVSTNVVEQVVAEFGRLTSLSCITRNEQHLQTILRALGTFPSPFLESVSIQSHYVRVLSPVLVVPEWNTKWCHNLKELTLKLEATIPFKQLTEMLESSPHLIHLQLRCPVSCPQDRAPFSVILLARLRVFDLDDAGSDIYMRLLLG
ncbi:hypothetical protein PM082_000582 [Marasmius tenuissimus]|nr:hypothetical protein PM082_000582 [Marasmius tenuissimus]